MPDARHSIVAEGTDVGVLGGLVVAVWFLLLDSIVGHPLQTPSLLGQVVLFGNATPDTKHLVFGAIVLYTAFHFLIFALLGVGLVATVHLAIREPVARYALVPLFLAFEVMVYGLLEMVSERTHDLFPFWAVITANTLAALAMGYFLWIRHPELQRSIRETPLGDAPMH
jgi:hypothetical protein